MNILYYSSFELKIHLFYKFNKNLLKFYYYYYLYILQVSSITPYNTFL